MFRTLVPRWLCLPAAVLFGLVVPFAATAQDAVIPGPTAGGETAKQTDGTAKPEPDATTKADLKAVPKPPPEFIRKTDAEWRKILTRAQYAVTRQKATEPAYSGRYATGHFKGTFLCVCCLTAGVESEVFSAQHKFESGTGWPSFYRAASDRALQTAWDYGEVEPRMEVVCRRCGAHLGHVFDDGPPPTGLRFCIDSIAIKLKPPPGEAPARQAASKTTSTSKKARPRVKAKAKSRLKVAPDPAKPDDSASSADSDQPPGSKEQQTEPGRRPPER